jgi:putative ABC transport system substrate-binding protein
MPQPISHQSGTLNICPPTGCQDHAPRDEGARVFRRVADQVDQIFKGTKVGEIPLYQPTTFALTGNLRPAKALGITVPTTAANEVIE